MKTMGLERQDKSHITQARCKILLNLYKYKILERNHLLYKEVCGERNSIYVSRLHTLRQLIKLEYIEEFPYKKTRYCVLSQKGILYLANGDYIKNDKPYDILENNLDETIEENKIANFATSAEIILGDYETLIEKLKRNIFDKTTLPVPVFFPSKVIREYFKVIDYFDVTRSSRFKGIVLSFSSISIIYDTGSKRMKFYPTVEIKLIEALSFIFKSHATINGAVRTKATNIQSIFLANSNKLVSAIVTGFKYGEIPVSVGTQKRNNKIQQNNLSEQILVSKENFLIPISLDGVEELKYVINNTVPYYKPLNEKHHTILEQEISHQILKPTEEHRYLQYEKEKTLEQYVYMPVINIRQLNWIALRQKKVYIITSEHNRNIIRDTLRNVEWELIGI